MPSSKISTTDDKPRTDFARSVSNVEGREDVLEWNGDQRFHLGGRHAGPLGMDLDERRREFRKTSTGIWPADRSQPTLSMATSRTTTTRSRKAVSMSQRMSRYFPTPNSTPYNSAAPLVTTGVFTSGPRLSRTRLLTTS